MYCAGLLTQQLRGCKIAKAVPADESVQLPSVRDRYRSRANFVVRSLEELVPCEHSHHTQKLRCKCTYERIVSSKQHDGASTQSIRHAYSAQETLTPASK